jgi:uracil-DNA glycosylase
MESPLAAPLPHPPRPVIRARTTATIAVCGQAPGTRVHTSGVPFCDPSGVRLRAWMDVRPEEFYDEARIAILPMGFCFPGLDANGGDLPPRPECAPAWRRDVLALLPRLSLLLLVGIHAQRWHLPAGLRRPTLWATVADWRTIAATSQAPLMLPLPHPSWRNNAHLKANRWFEAELLPVVRREVRVRLESA